MTAKQYLKQAYWLKLLIEAHKRELAQLREIMGGLQSAGTGDGVRASKWNGDTRESRAVVAFLDFELNIKREIEARAEKLGEIGAVVAQVPNEAERLLLLYRYVLCLEWQEIADRMKFSERQLHRLHGRALQHVKVPQDLQPQQRGKDVSSCQ